MARSTLARLVAKVAVGALAVVTPVALAPVAAQAAAGDLFISEYVEGSSNNKSIEIYNGTGATVDLAGYSLQGYSNGSATPQSPITLVGTVASGDVHVVANTSASEPLKAVADQLSGSVNFNGNDVVTLRKGTDLLDVVGQIGSDPGTEWGTGLTSTADNTLRRKDTVCVGDTDGSNAFDPATEWDGFAVDTFGGLGAHSTACSVPEEAPAVASTTPANGATATAGMSIPR
jgi:predicted extracellular nuclease